KASHSRIDRRAPDGGRGDPGRRDLPDPRAAGSDPLHARSPHVRDAAAAMENGQPAEGLARHHVGAAFGKVELVIYLVLAVLLAATALGALAGAAKQLWEALRHWDVGTEAPRVLNELLVVLMAVEVLNTVRISIRSHMLVIEPFLVVGLIAS